MRAGGSGHHRKSGSHRGFRRLAQPANFGEQFGRQFEAVGALRLARLLGCDQSCAGGDEIARAKEARR
jgi:hypothetical protein